MLEKQQLRMNVNPLSVQYPGVDSEIMFNSDDFTQDLNIRYEDWKDMGSPNVVTVTVEPGDKLNTPPVYDYEEDSWGNTWRTPKEIRGI